MPWSLPLLGSAQLYTFPSTIHQKIWGEFPSGLLVKNLPANAGEGFNPWSRKISHAMGQLKPGTATTGPTLWSL